ncbi:rhomboid family intramembrane serine protease [Nafulsella turpanensis]|uniref:rhomboid family intramembrane serine protease n=1 Tax=Nafulsella turpanensis TaxID=1265690 RepID=UPI00034D8C0C|nr:rhomboid family intramembrane serine protease [Nafulsella turpanensis]
MFRFSPVVKNLLIANVAIFVLSFLLYSQTGIDVNDYLALYYFASDNFEPWQFVTYMFLHANFNHIFGNMIGLIVFGTWLEEVWGSKRFLQYYLITGVGAGVLFMAVDYFEKAAIEEKVEAFLTEPAPKDFELLVGEYFSRGYNYESGFIDAYYENPESNQYERQARIFIQDAYNQQLNIPMLGASGAVFGILLAAGLLFPRRRIMLLIPPIPMRARILVVLYGAYEIYSIFQRAPDDNVAHFAHLGGMLVGYILLLAWQEHNTRYE